VCVRGRHCSLFDASHATSVWPRPRTATEREKRDFPSQFVRPMSYHPSVPRKLSLLGCFGCCLGTDESQGNDLEPLTRGGLAGFREQEQQLNDTLTMDLARSKQSRRAAYSKLGHLHDFSIDDKDEKMAKWPVLPHPRFRYALCRPRLLPHPHSRPTHLPDTLNTLNTLFLLQINPPSRIQDDHTRLGRPQ
jgi:hypothetical protein